MIRTYIKETIAFQVNDLMNLKIKTWFSYLYCFIVIYYIV